MSDEVIRRVRAIWLHRHRPDAGNFEYQDPLPDEAEAVAQRWAVDIAAGIRTFDEWRDHVVSHVTEGSDD